MRLYYTPGACSLSPHVTLRELGLPFELIKVDLRGKVTAGGVDFRTISPAGYVPALELDDGTVMTEGAIMVQYLGELKPEAGLVPAYGTPARWQLMQWLHFVATELHKGMSPLYNAKAGAEYRAALLDRLGGRLRVLEQRVGDGPYLMGAQFTVVDPYAFYVLRAWQALSKGDLTAWPGLAAYYARLGERPSVQAALAAEAPPGR